MKKILLAGACVLALVPFAALPTAAQTDPAQVGISTGAPGAQTGRDFVQFLMMSDKFEIATSQLALEKSRDPAIRDFAADMIAAHRESSIDLKSVSDRTTTGRTVTPPPVLDPRHQAMYQDLSSSSGARFDRIYLELQRGAHEEALAYLEGYADNGRVEPLADFADHMIPAIQGHMAMLAHIDSEVTLSDRRDRRENRDQDRDRGYPDRN